MVLTMQELQMQVHPRLLAYGEPLDYEVVRDILVGLFEVDGADFAKTATSALAVIPWWPFVLFLIPQLSIKSSSSVIVNHT